MAIISRLESRTNTEDVSEISTLAIMARSQAKTLLQQRREYENEIEKECKRANAAESYLSACKQELATATKKIESLMKEQKAADERIVSAQAHAEKAKSEALQAQAEAREILKSRHEAETAAASDAAARRAVESLLESERRARQEADKRVTAMTAELRRPLPQQTLPIIKRKAWTFDVARRDSSGNIVSIKATPEE